MRIEGTITLDDGSTSEFSLDLEYGWQQFGASPERLGRTVTLMDALESAMFDVRAEYESDDEATEGEEETEA